MPRGRRIDEVKHEESDEDVPLSEAMDIDSDDSDVPLARQLGFSKGDIAAVKEEVEGDAKDEEGEDDDDGGDDDDDDDDDRSDDDDGEDGSDSDKVGRKRKRSRESPAIEGSGEQKWTTLIHKGPQFPQPYVPLPEHVTLKYDGKPVRLPPETEEIAMFYAVKLETQHAANPIFNRNFFDDFKAELKRFPPRDGTRIQKFEKLDFRDMHNYWRSLKDAEAQRKKSLAPSARKHELETRRAVENEFKTCLVDGIPQRAGNVTVEPPGLFLGRGAHPKTGRIKHRVMPEQITINHSADYPAPQPPPGHKWAEIVEKKDVTWLALWRENINGNFKYVFLDATSTFKTESDRDKFEKARKLDECIKQVRADVQRNLKSKNTTDRMVATIIWLIDNFSLRAGNEKGEDEAETYGVCSLRCGHATLVPPNQLQLSFLGKDSMKFEETLTIENKDVYRNIASFMKTDESGHRKGPEDPIFAAPRSKGSKMAPLAPGVVNQFLGRYMKGLSAKVFRTYNASATFQGLLDQTDEWLASRPVPQERELNAANLRIAYNEANRQVAILCNHQKTVNQVALNKSLDRTRDKIFGLHYQIHKERQKLLTHHSAAELKKDYGHEYDFAKHWPLILRDPELDVTQIREHEEMMAAEKKARLVAAFERHESEVRYQEELKRDTGESEDPEKKVSRITSKEQLDEELRGVDEHLRVLEKERKTNKSEASTCNVPSCARRILAKYEAIKKQEAEMLNKNNTSDVSLGTSKLNYIDPRITFAWLKKWDAKLQEAQGKDSAAEPSPRKGGVKDEKPKDENPKDEKPALPAAPNDKIDLGLKVMNLNQFFTASLQKKFKWATFDDNGKDISPRWTFVRNARNKMRTLESGERK